MAQSQETGAAPNKIAVFGCGNMGGAILRGLALRAGSAVKGIIGYDLDRNKLELLTKEIGISTTTDPGVALDGVDLIIVAVKPQLVDEVLRTIKQSLGDRADLPGLISVAAGITVARMRRTWGNSGQVARVMPNLPCLLGCGISAVYSENPGFVAPTMKIFSTVGEVVAVSSEKELDAVTGLSGSGPGFVCLVLEALADGGVRAGLPRDRAQLLALHTVLGTARLINEQGVHPAVLREQIASPAGTTIAGLSELELRGVRGSIISAVQVASDRAAELGQS